jgi:hypothetical protein
MNRNPSNVQQHITHSSDRNPAWQSHSANEDEDEKQTTELAIPSETANDLLPFKSSNETKEKTKQIKKNKKGSKAASLESIENEHSNHVDKPLQDAMEIPDTLNEMQKRRPQEKKIKRKKKKGAAIKDLPASLLSSYGL